MVNSFRALPLCALAALAGCNEVTLFAEPAPTLPESVVAIAAPNQDLSTARLRETDNCYWYDHRGVVETTALPLRSKSGNHICIKTEAAPAPAA